MDKRTLGLALIRAYHHAAQLPAGNLSMSYVRPAFDAGRAMIFAERLRAQGNPISGQRAEGLAQFLGIPRHELVNVILPALYNAAVLDYRLDTNGELVGIEEYVGVTAQLLEQTATVFEEFSPTLACRACVVSGHVATQAPMTQRNHTDAVNAAGIPEPSVHEGISAASACGMLRAVNSPALGEDLIYNEYVWASGIVEVAGFLRQLPEHERETILGVVNEAAQSPGIAIPRLTTQAPDPNVLQGARRVGLVDSVKVRSRTGAGQTYAFSPLLERELSARHASDALHERKLVVAHILFGHEFGKPSTGRIDQPLVLLNALLRKGEVGPATAISTDYMLLESHGILRVRPASASSRSYLELVKEDVVRDARELLRKGQAFEEGGPDQGSAIEGLWLPGWFVPPEEDRASIPEAAEGVDELFDGLIQRLHEEASKVARDESF